MSNELVVAIDIAAQPETVFRFLSDPVLFQQWMGPAAELTARSVTVHYPSGSAARGTIREVIPNRKLVFGWGYDDHTHGIGPDTTVITIELEPIPLGTRVTLRHAGLDEVQQTEHRKGWTHYLAQLAAGAANIGLAEALPKAVDAYIAAWNETDWARRTTLLEQCWEPEGVFRDSMGVAEGRESLLHYISGAQQFVPGFHLELNGTPEQCHGYYRFPWLIRQPDGNVMARGTNYGQLSSAGRFLLAIGFWDQ